MQLNLSSISIKMSEDPPSFKKMSSSFSWSTKIGESKETRHKKVKKHKQVNQYLLLTELGEGSFSKVYLGQDQSTLKYYALKRVFLMELSKTSSGIQQLETEIEIMRKIKHPNIISLREVIHVVEDSLVYIVIEFADCGNLSSVLESGFKFTPEQIQNIFAQVISGISFLHQNCIVHQDIKPSNILIKSNGRVLISDFGIGHSFAYAAMVVGTPAYQAPEVIDDSEIFDLSSENLSNFEEDISSENSNVTPGEEDVWSLGVTLYELVFHDLPFYGGNVFEIVRSIVMTDELDPPGPCDPTLWDLITKMLTVDPKKRITMQEIMEHPYLANASTEKNVIEGLKAFVPPVLEPDAKIKHIKGIVCNENYSFYSSEKPQSILLDGLEE